VFAGRISDFAKPRRLALAFLELQTNFGGNVLTPDIAVYTWDRIPRDADGRLVDDILGAPDIAAEIASPEQSANALVRRCIWYVENGVHLAPLIDPEDDSVIVFRPGASPRALRGTDRIDLDEVLPGFELTVQELFDSLRLD
jgi:Uma2 family endonuclease